LAVESSEKLLKYKCATQPGCHKKMVQGTKKLQKNPGYRINTGFKKIKKGVCTLAVTNTFPEKIIKTNLV